MSPIKDIYQLDADGMRMYDNQGNYIRKGDRKSPDIVEEQMAQVVKLLKEGKTPTAVSILTGVSYLRVKGIQEDLEPRWVEKASEKIAFMIVRPRRRYTRGDLDEVAETVKKIMIESIEEWG